MTRTFQIYCGKDCETIKDALCEAQSPNKGQNLPLVPVMASITKEIVQISGVVTNTRSSMKTLVTTTTGLTSLYKKSKDKPKGKGARFINVFYSPQLSNNIILFQSPLPLNQKLVNTIF